MTIALVILAMVALMAFAEIFNNPGRVCPMCNGRRAHGRNCPYRKDG